MISHITDIDDRRAVSLSAYKSLNRAIRPIFYVVSDLRLCVLRVRLRVVHVRLRCMLFIGPMQQ
jgi:hypothetical protein